ncbi:MAG TPA: hypothetical protein VEW66_06465 [Thermomicrobiales bacterium]|nr:hypothetical protein [Thermomicrobiales bacterium]
MVTNLVSPSFSGTKQQQALAADVYNVLRSRGMFMTDYSPIHAPLADLAEFLKIDAKQISAAIAANPEVFSTVTVDDVQRVQTTRLGRAPLPNDAPTTHSFVDRFITPLPKPERPERPVPERARVDPNWATYSVPDFGDEDEDELYGDTLDDVDDVELIIVTESPQSAVEVEPMPDTVEAEEVVVNDEVAAIEEVEAIIAEPTPTEPTPAVAAPSPTPFRTRPVATDFSSVADGDLAAALSGQFADDQRIAQFAGRWMAEDRVARLGRNDLRKIKEYISEQEQPLTDEVLATDILNVRPNSADFAAIQFAVNFRLSREHRDFDFVGTNDQRFWSTSSLPQIGTTRRKPNDIGTDYRFLVDETPATIEHRSVSSVSRVVSFYEFIHGLLPYDAEMQQLLPKQVLVEQRSAVLTFEIPQFYTTYLVELRYPTPNRGGYILGLDDFYAESLVPGALISITATENDGHYTVEFLQGGNQSARLLDLDDRRSPRYHFRPTSFTCEVSPEWLVSEDRFPGLGNEKPLDDKTRRRPEAVVEATFERIGIEDGNTLISTFAELLTVANVERPFSTELLRTTLDQHAKITSDDGDTFTYAAN